MSTPTRNGQKSGKKSKKIKKSSKKKLKKRHREEYSNHIDSDLDSHTQTKSRKPKAPESILGNFKREIVAKANSLGKSLKEVEENTVPKAKEKVLEGADLGYEAY